MNSKNIIHKNFKLDNLKACSSQKFKRTSILYFKTNNNNNKHVKIVKGFRLRTFKILVRLSNDICHSFK